MRVAVNGVRLFVDVDGAKLRPDGPWLREVPTVVLVHTGPGTDHTAYKETIGPVVAEDAQMVYLDLRGHGRSEPSTPDTWRVDTWASDLLALFDRLEIEQPALIGGGFGSFVALRFAQQWPERISKLVVVNPAARTVVARVVARFDELGGAAAGEAAYAFYEHPDERTLAEYMHTCLPVMLGPGYVVPAMLTPIWNLQVAVEWVREEATTLDLRVGLDRVTTDTLIVGGTADPQYPVASIEEVAAGIPHAHVRWFEGARHAVYRDAPESIALVKDFVTR